MFFESNGWILFWEISFMGCEAPARKTSRLVVPQTFRLPSSPQPVWRPKSRTITKEQANMCLPQKILLLFTTSNARKGPWIRLMYAWVWNVMWTVIQRAGRPGEATKTTTTLERLTATVLDWEVTLKSMLFYRLVTISGVDYYCGSSIVHLSNKFCQLMSSWNYIGNKDSLLDQNKEKVIFLHHESNKWQKHQLDLPFCLSHKRFLSCLLCVILYCRENTLLSLYLHAPYLHFSS